MFEWIFVFLVLLLLFGPLLITGFRTPEDDRSDDLKSSASAGVRRADLLDNVQRRRPTSS